MSSIQERLQLKRVPLDTWNIREQLCLASAVVRSGDQNWMSVSRALKTVGETNRPPDWYSQKSCAAQYGALLEHVETPKRKKRSSEGAVETPQESILKRLTQDRIVEIQKTLAEMNQEYEQLTSELTEARNPSTSDDRIRELWNNVETAKRARERENATRAAWLKEREERRARAERTWRPPSGSQTSPAGSVTPPTPSSPLLTSLLKSSPVVTTPQHIPHPATVVETLSPSAGAPTLSMLLEKTATTTATTTAVGHDNKHAAIEHIKSQLVQIEHQLKANPSTPPPLSQAPPAPAVDIDDIEIKAEDVYAFRDIDIHIPPVTTMHKATPRPTEKPTFKKDDVEIPEVIAEETPTESIIEDIKEEPVVSEPEPVAEVIPLGNEVVPEDIVAEEEPQTAEEAPEPEVKIAFPEVKFPTPEIKVIQPDEQRIKEEIKEPEAVPVPDVEKETEKEIGEEVPVAEESTPAVEETIEQQKETPEPPEIVPEQIPLPPEEPPEPIPEPMPIPDLAEIPLPPDPSPEISVEQCVETVEEAPVQPEPEIIPAEEVKVESQEQTEQNEQSDAEVVEKTEDVIKTSNKDEDAEDSIPLKEMIKEELAQSEIKLEPADVEDAHTETDDDTPMELSREEEKDGKKKRDYSRKKKSDSRTCSGSESAAEASAPDSPSANDAERQHRLWKKSVMLVYSRLCAHKYASLFLRPISDEEAPGYSMVVKRPMDFSTIRKNIEAGTIRTTAEFQRDVLLMLSNALMYNSSEHSVYTMAKEMHEEAGGQLGMLLAAQAHAGLCEPHARRKRRRPESPLTSTTHKRHHH